MRSIAVFCGSSLGGDAGLACAAEELGRLLAARGMRLIYGGGNIGLMGKLATAALAAGGPVTGVIPRFMMSKEIGKIELSDLRIVESMHERKALMNELADGFIALPGGFGTLEEFCEVLTWGQLGLHGKPLGLLNTGGFYDHFLAFLDHAVAKGLVKAKHRGLLLTAGEPAELLEAMAGWKGLPGKKWITPERT
jgi:uncharacterized protein (TIGR00730 family)